MSTLERSKAGRRSRSKGGRGEREVIELLKASGWPNARRNFQSGGQGGGDALDGPEACHIEIKHVERLHLHAAYAQCLAGARPTDIPIIAHRRNHSPWLATLPLDELLPLLRLREAG